MVPPPFRNGRVSAHVAVPEHFEAFYRSRLRRLTGRRLRSSDLMSEYVDWSGSMPTRPAVNYHQMRRYMNAIGHGRAKSNGIQYLDVVLARDTPELGDTLPALPLSDHAGSSVIADAVASIDATVDHLNRVRRVLTGEAKGS